jgi:hypothetical protein
MADALLGRKLALAASCPYCYTRPRLRTCEAQRDVALYDDPDMPVVEYRCHGCDRDYWITKRAFQEAA